MIKVKDPSKHNEQLSRGIDLHLLELGRDNDNNKDVLENVKSRKNAIKSRVPTHFEDFLTQCKGLLGLSAIAFGT